MVSDGSGHSNEKEHQKTDYAVVNDSDVPVGESPHKRAQISALANYKGGLDGSELMKKNIKQLSLLRKLL